MAAVVQLSSAGPCASSCWIRQQTCSSSPSSSSASDGVVQCSQLSSTSGKSVQASLKLDNLRHRGLRVYRERSARHGVEVNLNLFRLVRRHSYSSSITEINRFFRPLALDSRIAGSWFAFLLTKGVVPGEGLQGLEFASNTWIPPLIGYIHHIAKLRVFLVSACFLV